MGIGLVLLGGIVLAGELLASVFGFGVHWWEVWRLWPLIIIGAGVLLTGMGALGVRNRGMGVMFVPATPLLTVGGMLMVNCVTGWWHLWALAWPLVVLAVALGFLLAAFFTRLIWL